MSDSIAPAAPAVKPERPTAHVVTFPDGPPTLTYTGPSRLDDAEQMGFSRGYDLESSMPPAGYSNDERAAFARGYREGTHARWSDEAERQEFRDEYGSFLDALRRDDGRYGYE